MLLMWGENCWVCLCQTAKEQIVKRLECEACKGRRALMPCVARGDLFPDSDSNGLWEGQLHKVCGECGCDILSQWLQPFFITCPIFFMSFPDGYSHDRLLWMDIEFQCNLAFKSFCAAYDELVKLSIVHFERLSKDLLSLSCRSF